MCHGLSDIQRLTPQPGHCLVLTCQKAKPASPLHAIQLHAGIYSLTFPKLHRAHVDHKLPPCPHHTTCMVS